MIAKVRSPGEILVKDFLEPRGMSVIDFAKLAECHLKIIQDIIDDKETIYYLSDILSKIFDNTTTDYWNNLQRDYERSFSDQERIRRSNCRKIWYD